MIIVVLKWTLLTFVFIGKDKTKWGKVKFYTHSTQIAKYSVKITRGYLRSKKSHYALRRMELSQYLKSDFFIFLFG